MRQLNISNLCSSVPVHLNHFFVMLSFDPNENIRKTKILCIHIYIYFFFWGGGGQEGTLGKSGLNYP